MVKPDNNWAVRKEAAAVIAPDLAADGLIKGDRTNQPNFLGTLFNDLIKVSWRKVRL